MPLTIELTPGETWPNGTKLTLARLRKAAKPTLTLTGQLSATDVTDNSLTRAKIKHEDFFYGAEAGAGADAIVITLSPAPASLVDGLRVIFKAAGNKTSAATLNINGLGAKPIYKHTGTALRDNDIRDNQIVEVVYNSDLNSGSGAWQMTSQLHNKDADYAVATGTGGSFAVTLDPAPLAYWAGMVVRFQANHSPTSIMWLNVNGLGAKSIRKFGTQNALKGDIVTNQVVVCAYDGTNFQIISAANKFDELATDTGSANAYQIATSLSILTQYDGLTLRWKATNANTGASTIQLNGGSALPIKKRANRDLDAGDIQANQIVEMSYDAAADVWQLIGPVAPVRYETPVASYQAFPTTDTFIEFTHGLGALPDAWEVVMVCDTANLSYAAGDEVKLDGIRASTGGKYPFAIMADATKLRLTGQFATAGTPFLTAKDGASEAVITAGSWKIKAYAVRY